MRKLIGISLVIAVISLLIGCTGSDTVKASLDEEFTLAIGESASISSENLKIKFLDVTADSRCPKDVQCIQAGSVSCDIEITKDGVNYLVHLKPVEIWRSDWGNTFQNYWLLFDVLPYPEEGKPIAKNDYRLLLTVKNLPI